MKNKSLYHFLGYFFLLPYLVLFAIFFVLPLFYGLALSFFRWEMISPIAPKFIAMGNYLEAFKSDYFWKAMWATFRFVIMAVPLNVGIALLVATGLNALSLKRQAIYRAVYFLPTLMTIAAAGILWRWFYNGEFGLFNALLSFVGIKIPWLTNASFAMKSVVLMTIWWTMGGTMIILLAGLASIPEQYYEAASLDGANIRQKFFYITLPTLRPVLLFVVVMNIIASFQVFGQTYIITAGGPELSTRVIVQYIYDTAFGEYRMGYGAALSWLLFLVIAAFSVLQFRIMRER